MRPPGTSWWRWCWTGSRRGRDGGQHRPRHAQPRRPGRSQALRCSGGGIGWSGHASASGRGAARVGFATSPQTPPGGQILHGGRSTEPSKHWPCRVDRWRRPRTISSRRRSSAGDARDAYTDAVARILEATRDGALLRGEVLARWQDFVGTGEFFRAMEQNIGRFRDRMGAFFRGEPAPAVGWRPRSKRGCRPSSSMKPPRPRRTPTGAGAPTRPAASCWAPTTSPEHPRFRGQGGRRDPGLAGEPDGTDPHRGPGQAHAGAVAVLRHQWPRRRAHDRGVLHDRRPDRAGDRRRRWHRRRGPAAAGSGVRGGRRPPARPDGPRGSARALPEAAGGRAAAVPGPARDAGGLARGLAGHAAALDALAAAA